MFRYADKSSGLLFSSQGLSDLTAKLAKRLRDEVESIDANRLLNTAPADLAAYLAEKYRLDPPALRRDEWSAEESETKIDVSGDQNRWISDRSRPFYVPGQRIDVEVPFDGDSELFYVRPNQFSLSPPRAAVRGRSLLLSFEIPHEQERDVRSETDRSLAEIEQNLSRIRGEADQYNRSLPYEAETAVSNRRARLLANQGRVAALGIPLKKRAGAPSTYAMPDVRRRIVPTLPPAASVPYEPEPVLDAEHYEHVLSVVQNMVQVMERSPSSFAHMGEEALRDHFLVQLNGQFEGRATGETFNAGGKTDVLLRENGRNVFIAECKFWKGPKHYAETIDQLLGYSSWRDAKTAILVFNRGTSTSTVLDGVRERTEAHQYWKRTVDWKHESGFRYVFHHPGDRNRELTVTVLVFDVPSPSSTG